MGCEYYLEHGRMMPEDGPRTLAEYDGIYLGAVGWPTVADHVSPWGLLLPIRRGFDQYVNLRPARLLRGVEGPPRKQGANTLDMLVGTILAKERRIAEKMAEIKDTLEARR